jgi:tetratricopeptide (TPR) repeat protein
MYELLILVLFAVLAYWNLNVRQDDFSEFPQMISDRIGKLWDIAHLSIKENRFLKAEKALLTILKIDEKNVAAYNRLGILYAKQKEYKDAIDCFEIASSLESSPSSLHNLGLIYYDTENYEKAAIAFEEALKLETDLATRHVAYAKVQEKLGNSKLMIKELIKAVELEPTRESYNLLYKTYLNNNMLNEAEQLKKKLRSKIIKKNKPMRLKRPRKVVY